jgi:hypothetical protein
VALLLLLLLNMVRECSIPDCTSCGRAVGCPCDRDVYGNVLRSNCTTSTFALCFTLCNNTGVESGGSAIDASMESYVQITEDRMNADMQVESKVIA